MKNKADYSKYECPYSHLEKECGHELKGVEGYQDVYSVWCACGFRAPVFYLDPDELGLKLKKETDVTTCEQQDSIMTAVEFLEATNVQEKMKVEICKDLLVELYEFAYEQAVKTNTVENLHDIDRRINGG